MAQQGAPARLAAALRPAGALFAVLVITFPAPLVAPSRWIRSAGHFLDPAFTSAASWAWAANRRQDHRVDDAVSRWPRSGSTVTHPARMTFG
jgi:hypothetical protein